MWRSIARWLTLGAALGLAACGPGDASPPNADAGSASDAAVAMPATPPPGFAVISLAPPSTPSTPSTGASPAANASGAGTGEFWYSLDNGTFEWFVRAEHLVPDRAYRVELTADENARYAIASLRSDSAGTLTGHGILTEFRDRACVGSDASPPRPLDATHAVRVAIKNDGSGARSASLMSPSSDQPCLGNDDANWDYVLVQPSAPRPLSAGAAQAGPR